ncbi:MAG: spore coat protein [Oscillospiraceae bacterium]|nr:spore coat protein [Oscillospiraceae bacterium]
MPTPISTKELSGLEDILGVEKTLAAKYQTYSNMCPEPNLKKKFSQVSSKHQKHFNTLVTHLNG